MSTGLQVVNQEQLPENVRNEIDSEIDKIIERHKNNRYEINKLVFESVAALTSSENYSNELASQGIFKRFWGGITGKNRALQTEISRNQAAAQYASQQSLQKLAEQNLMSFELITAMNNKLNNSMVEVETEINKIYGTLVTFFKQTKSDIVQLENRVARLERNVNLLNWQNSIEYQMWDGTEYTELTDIEKIACIVNDFYEITQGNYTTSDLLLLKSAMTTIELNINELVSYQELATSIEEDERISNKIFHGKCESEYVEPWSVVVASGVRKLEKFDNEEKYIVDCVKDCLDGSQAGMNREVIINKLFGEYLENNLLVNKDGKLKLYDMIVELLYNIEQLEYIPEKTDEERTAEAEKFFIKGEFETAYHIFKQLAEEGVPRAMYFMGEYLRWGYGYYFGLDYDKEGGFQWHQKGAELGDPLCILNTSYMYEGEEKKNIQQSIIDKIREMAQAGDIFVQNELADIVEGEEKFELLKESAEHGLARSMEKLGNMYEYGRGVEENEVEAFKWYMRAAELGNKDALANVGWCYQEGHGVDSNINKAIEYYEKSIKRGCNWGAWNLAVIYENGDKVKGDYYKAFEYYTISANMGYAESINRVGIFYEYGKGTEKNETMAMEYYKRAAKLGLAVAQSNLATCYKVGRGCEQDLEKAKEWAMKAAKQGDEIAIKNLKEWFEIEV